jgi:hypothetical protein
MHPGGAMRVGRQTPTKSTSSGSGMANVMSEPVPKRLSTVIGAGTVGPVSKS